MLESDSPESEASKRVLLRGTAVRKVVWPVAESSVIANRPCSTVRSSEENCQ